jgi:hypothetical protein
MEDTAKRQRYKIYSIGWHIIVSVCAVLALILAIKNSVYACCPIENIMNYMGVIVTTVGLVITVYFVISAIDIFSISREIKSNREILKNDRIAFQKRGKEYDKILKDYAQSLYDGFEIQIGLKTTSRSRTNGKSDILLQSLYINKARLSYKYPMLDVSLREALLNELGSIGEIQDVIPIQNIIDNENEPEEIKKIARKVLEELKKRLGIS